MRLAFVTVALCVPLLFVGVPPEKPTLFVVHSSSCPPCRHFVSHWSNTPGFADRIRSGFTVTGLNWEDPAEQLRARQLGVRQLPSFVVVSPRGAHLGMIVGFTSADQLLKDLRLPPVVRQASQSRPVEQTQQTPQRPADPGPVTDATARREIERLEAAIPIRPASSSQERR